MQHPFYGLLRWAKACVSQIFVRALLSAFGFLWLFVEIIDYFWNNLSPLVRQHDVWFLALGLVYAGWRCKPRERVSGRLAGRDVVIEIAVGNIYRFPGALVVGSNTTFDTQVSPQLISEESIQGQFTRRYYSNSQELDIAIARGLEELPFQELPGKRIGKAKRYDVGTVVKVMPKGRTGYFTAIADINEHGNASSDVERIRVALTKLWLFIGERGGRDPILMPVLGTGFSRVNVTREQIIRETIQSFVAACAEKVFCENLTVVISPRDAERHSIDLEKLGSYLAHVCEYTEVSSSSSIGVGTGIDG